MKLTVKKMILMLLACVAMASCTNLDEKLYGSIGSDNYYHKASDIKRMVYRPFEHAYWTITARMFTNELTADQIICPKRDDGTWDNNGMWRRLHTHDIDPTIELYPSEWSSCFQGVGECNFSLEELDRLSPEDFGLTKAEFDNWKSQNRVLRAWFYLRLLDAYRNIPLITFYTGATIKDTEQVAPEVTFKFIEDELLDCFNYIEQKQALGTQASIEGRWTKAGAAALLVRLYLNAEVYLGVDRYDDCALYAQKILDGEYGPYTIGDGWDEIFDWNNDTSDEMIFGFPSSGGYTFWVYDHEVGGTYWNTVPYNSNKYFGDTKANAGVHNQRYSVSPSYSTYGELYNFELGMPVQKFRKYPQDARMTKYRNLGNGKREGMFLYGYLEYEEDGATKRITAGDQYDIYLRDAVGNFGSLDADSWLGGTSDMTTADRNSGWAFVKYPFYGDDEKRYQLEADFVEIRLPEIIYSLAECKLRRNDVDGAARLLNSVRRRNYPEEVYDEVLYAPEGSAVLDMNEMLDEWGREFFAESRRRIDLIRFDKFSSGIWWEKSADPDKHCEIFPLTATMLSQNHYLKQNPGYSH